MQTPTADSVARSRHPNSEQMREKKRETERKGQINQLGALQKAVPSTSNTAHQTSSLATTREGNTLQIMCMTSMGTCRAVCDAVYTQAKQCCVLRVSPCMQDTPIVKVLPRCNHQTAQRYKREAKQENYTDKSQHKRIRRTEKLAASTFQGAVIQQE